MGKLVLSTADRRFLAELEKKYQLVRDRTVGVASGRHTGFFCGGRGGIGKSTIIEDELRRREIPFILTNSHLTGRGLVDRLYDFPDHVHLIEDIEEAVRDPQAMGVLKSALWGTRRNREGRLEALGDLERTWRRHRIPLLRRHLHDQQLGPAESAPAGGAQDEDLLAGSSCQR